GDRRRRGAHEHEVDDGLRREVVDGAHHRHAEHLAALEVGAVDAALVALRQDVVQRDEAELPRMARDTGHDHTARLEQRAEARRVVRGLHAEAASSSTSASTATGTPSTISNGLTSTATMSGRALASRA